MELITSNFPPVRLLTKEFYSLFEEKVMSSDHVKIATGYVSAEALTEVEAIARENENFKFEIVIGMHKFDGFTRQQYESALRLNNKLKQEGRGGVNVCTAFPYHGKVYLFLNNNECFAGTVGSSNLDSILDTHRTYETDLLINDRNSLEQLGSLFENLFNRASRPIDELNIPEFIDSTNRALENVEMVERISDHELIRIRNSLTDISFEIPIKDDTPKSNLNVYFGKGRENVRTGFIRPRHWYEVELIVPRNITESVGYPVKGTPFRVITDDAWTFECNVNGDYSKNFRSIGNLQILGRWLKGRLEEAGCLRVGESVDRRVLDCYGRNTFSLTATNEPNVWYIDFSR